MQLLGVLISNYVWLIGWFLGALVLGLAFTGLVRDRAEAGSPWPNAELAVFFPVCTGIALHVLVLIALAAGHLLRAEIIIGAFALLTLASLFALAARPAALRQFAMVFRRPLSEWLRILPLVLLILPWVLRPLGPAGGSDALTYHLPYARWYLEHGGLVVNETLRFPLHSHNVNLLYSAALIRDGAALPQMLHAGFGFMAMIGVYGLARHWHGWLAGLLAAAGLLLLGEFRFSFTTAFVDNGAVLFITAAFLALARWDEDRSASWLWMAALFAGSAMGTKYLGALFTVPLGLYVLWRSKDLRTFLLFALAVSVAGGFWYLRSWWISGNPLHPFAGDIFGHYLWTANELRLQMLELTGYGLDKTFANFWLMPWKMYSEHSRFNGITGHGGLVLGAFLLSCALLRWQRPAVRAMQLTALTFLVFWFASSQVIRYFMLVLPIMSLAAVVAFARVLAQIRPPGPAPKIPGLAGRLGLGLVLAVMGVHVLYVIQTDLAKIPLAPERQADYLATHQPAYEIGLAASADPRVGDGPVLQFMLQELRYFYPGQVYGDWMGVHPFFRYGHSKRPGYWEVDDSETLYRKVVADGIRAVALNKYPEDQFVPQQIDSYRAHFDFVIETDHAVLMVPRAP